MDEIDGSEYDLHHTYNCEDSGSFCSIIFYVASSKVIFRQQLEGNFFTVQLEAKSDLRCFENIIAMLF